jgi:hypothetical protein
MNPSSFTPDDRAALYEQAVRRAHELRRQAIVDAWNALFRLLRRLANLQHEGAGPRRPGCKA